MRADPAPPPLRGVALEPVEDGSVGGRPEPEVPAGPNLGPGRLLARSLELMWTAAPDLRRGALAVGLQFLGLFGPVLVLVAVAVARLPDPTILFGEGPPATPADAELGGLVGLGILLALTGGTALAIESRAIGLALIGAGATGRRLSLRAALRRSRQSFWRLVGLAVFVEVPLSLVGTLVGEGLAGPGARGSLLAAALGFVGALALQLPIAYAGAAIVVGGLGLRAALRDSVRLVFEAPRLAPLVVAVGGAGQVLLVLALSGGLELVGLVADVAGLGLTGEPPRTFATLALLLGLSSAVGSLLFSVTCLAVAPQAVVVALARSAPGLAPSVLGEDADSSRWLSLPMALGIATLVLLSVVGIENIVGRA